MGGDGLPYSIEVPLCELPWERVGLDVFKLHWKASSWLDAVEYVVRLGDW